MSNVRIESLSISLLEELAADPSISAFIKQSYFGYSKFFTATEAQALFLNDLKTYLQAEGQGVAIYEDDILVCISALKMLPWDSNHFGLKMGRLVIYSTPGVSASLISPAIQTLITNFAAEHQLMHLSADICIDDYSAVNVVLNLGFELLDIKRHYYCDDFNPPPRMIRHQSSVRDFSQDDRDLVMSMLSDFSFSTRFSRDAVLDQGRVQDMYQIWLDSLLSGTKTERQALVFDGNKGVSACGAISIKHFESLGVAKAIYSGGLYISKRTSAGEYIPIMNELINQAIKQHGGVETIVSLNNSAACRVIDAFASYRNVYMCHSLRLWLGDK